MLNGDDTPHPRTLNNDPFAESEPRGRPSKISHSQIKEMDRILQSYGLEGRQLTWEQLGKEACVEACGRTIKKTMESLDYHKCIACTKGWLSNKSAKKRVKFADAGLQLRPEPEDWELIRFSDKMHSGFGPRRRLRIIRRPGERYCPDCIQY